LRIRQARHILAGHGGQQAPQLVDVLLNLTPIRRLEPLYKKVLP
jgi:hypothetical protein